MKILVMIKQVPDTATQVKIAGDAKTIDAAGITWIVSPYDEYAVEEALRIKEKRGQGEVVAVSLGPDRVKEALRSCLAMGADRAIHLLDAGWDSADTLMTARALAGVIKQEGPALAFFGRQAIDDDMASVGAQVAEFLGWPCASWIMEEAVDEAGKTVRVGRQVEGGLELFDLPLPAVVSAQKGLNEPRYPTLKGIMGAKKKEIRDVKAADLGITQEPPALSVLRLEALPPRPPGRIIPGEPGDAVKELVRALREDAKAIQRRAKETTSHGRRILVHGRGRSQGQPEEGDGRSAG
jgi:electron transfer flavoprotein beta subunit